MTPKPRRLSPGEDPGATPLDDDRWQMWLPNCERPLEHPAVSSIPAELHLKPSKAVPEVPPKRVVAVVSDLYGAQAARTIREEGVSEVIAWSWRLPERIAANLEADGIGVVFGFHTADELEAAQHKRRGTSDHLTLQLAELEELAGLDSEAA
ncbi:MAG: hypothetical protein F4Z31_01590 [Gemmatimonadetes bacterium]|nr:hypothetical protein [Gemmatimonadota bacterium]